MGVDQDFGMDCKGKYSGMVNVDIPVEPSEDSQAAT
jgi:hypothetical protein